MPNQISIRPVAPTEGVASFLVRNRAVSSLHYAPISRSPTIAETTSGSDLARADLTIKDGMVTLAIRLVLSSQMGCGTTAVSRGRAYEALAFRVLSSAHTQSITLKLSCALSNQTGIPCGVFDLRTPGHEYRKVLVGTGSENVAVEVAPNNVITIVSFLFGNPRSGGPVDANFGLTIDAI
jgi:hypothetical protein